MPSSQKSSIAPGRAPAEDVVPHAGQVGLEPRGERSDTVATSSMPGVPEKFDVRAAPSSTSPKQKRRMSRSWMECSIRHPPPAWATSARHCRGVGALNGEVLVVAEDGGHRATQLRPTRTRSRRARKTGADRSTRPDCAGTPAGGHRVDQRAAAARSVASGFSQKTARPAASGCVDGLAVGRRRGADPDRVAAARPRRPRRPRPRRRRTALGEPARPARSLRSWTAAMAASITPAVDHRLEAQAVGPGDQARADEPDPQHRRETRSRRGRLVRRASVRVGVAPPRASMNRAATIDQHGDLVALAAPDGDRRGPRTPSARSRAPARRRRPSRWCRWPGRRRCATPRRRRPPTAPTGTSPCTSTKPSRSQSASASQVRSKSAMSWPGSALHGRGRGGGLQDGGGGGEHRVLAVRRRRGQLA